MNSENLKGYKLRSLVLYAINYQCFNSCLQFKDVFLFTISFVLTNVMSSLLYNYYCHFVDETKVQIRVSKGWHSCCLFCFLFNLFAYPNSPRLFSSKKKKTRFICEDEKTR